MIRTFTCETCNVVFTRDLGSTHPGRKYCSRVCMGRAKQLSGEHRGETAEKLLCTKCNDIKPVTEFYPHVSVARGYQYWCKPCMHQMRTERAKIPVDPYTRRRYALWTLYRITPDDYEEMYRRQQGRCGICGVPKERWEPVSVKDRPRFLMVDHDHATGKVRGPDLRRGVIHNLDDVGFF